MAYDDRLASRIRRLLKGRRQIEEKEQFGGIGFLVPGNVACGVIKNDLLVRVGPAGHEAALADKHARPFALTQKPARGWVLIALAGLRTEAGLRGWVDLCLRFAQSLPAK